MQLVGHFNTFFRETVNLPDWRLKQLSERVDSIYKALKKDDTYGRLITGKIPQGSWPHRMIIKPKPNLEYDADVLLCLNENADWDGDKAQYIEQLYWALGRVGYANRHRKTRCVRVQYANDSHIDLIPYVTTWYGHHIVNKQTGSWEDTNPEGFTSWVAERDDMTNGNFRKVVRLMKYIRDHRGAFSGTRSIILTTLLGNQVDNWTKIANPSAYGSVPNTLVTLTEDLNDWLLDQRTMPDVEDPSSPGTFFTPHRWSEESYQHFRNRIATLAPEMRDALCEPNPEKSAEKWRLVFGDQFKKETTENKSASPLAPASVAGGVGWSSASRSGRAG
ncbi:MAG: hypothetical protein VB093_11790 [Propionicimonas sp.]|nr:hypothetical protein [Propionicimonas sp.]